MNNDPSNSDKKPVPADSLHVYTIALPLVGLLVLFILGVRAGGDALDSEILVLVRFLSLLTLAMGVFTTIVVGLNYTTIGKRWTAGQVAAGFMALSSGYLWSASAFGAGFLSLMAGLVVITLLMFRELGNRSQRRRIGRQVKNGRLS